MFEKATAIPHAGIQDVDKQFKTLKKKGNCNLFSHKAIRSSYEFFKTCPCVPDRIGIWKCWFLRSRCGTGWRTGVAGEKPLEARERNNKLNPHMSSTPEVEPGPKWWEKSDLTTVPSLSQVSTSSPCPFRSFTKTQFLSQK